MAAAAEPPLVWNYLALPYTFDAYLTHDAAGNLAALPPLQGTADLSPATVQQSFSQDGGSSVESDGVTIK